MIEGLRIVFEPNDLRRVIRAMNRIMRAVDREKVELPYRMATDYVFLLMKNIMSQKHMGGYPLYNERYRKWKSQYFMMRGFWIMRGEVVKNLTVFRDRGYKNRWYGGLAPDAGMVPGSSWFMPPGSGKPKSINMYAYLNEFGGTKSPKRPIFTPTKEEYEKDGFRKRVRESRNLIGRSWK